MDIPDFVLAAARREFPCVCTEDYTARGKVAPHCRHDDMQHALEAAWEATNPPTCCARCRAEWETRASTDGAPFSMIISRPMFICRDCGDKRCAKADDHRAPCEVAVPATT